MGRPWWKRPRTPRRGPPWTRDEPTGSIRGSPDRIAFVFARRLRPPSRIGDPIAPARILHDRLSDGRDAPLRAHGHAIAPTALRRIERLVGAGDERIQGGGLGG